MTLCNIHKTKSLSNIILFAISSSCARGQRFVGPCQQSQGISKSSRLFECTRETQRHRHDFAQELVGVLRILDHYLGDNPNKRCYSGLRYNTFDAQDVEA